MLLRLAFLLQLFSIRNVCFLFFLVAPVLQDNKKTPVMIVALAVAYGICGLILALALAEKLSTLSDRVRMRGLDLLVLLMIALCLGSVLINAPERLVSPAALFLKYGKLVFPVACMFVMISIWKDRDLHRLYQLTLVACVASALFLIPELLMNGWRGVLPRLASFHIDSNKYALFLNIVYGMTLPLVIRGYLDRRVPPVAVLVIGLVAIQLLFSQSRGGMLANMVITVICFAPKAARPARKILAVIILLGVFVFAAIMVQRYVGGGRDASATGSDMGRLLTYSVGAKIVSDKPLTGVGFARTVDLYREYGPIELAILGSPLAIHNVFLEIWAEVGVVGLVVFCLLVFVPIFQLVTRIRQTSRTGEYPILDLAALSVPLAFLGFGVVSPNYLVENYFWTFMAFTIIVLRSPLFGNHGAKVLAPKWFGRAFPA